MKAVALACLLSISAFHDAQAETAVRGFNPRFVTAPSNPDHPNYRAPDRPPHQFDFSVSVDAYQGRDGDEDYRRGGRHRGPRHGHRGPRYMPPRGPFPFARSELYK